MAGQGLGVVILAAGRGKRFPGVPSKVLVSLGGRALIQHVLDSAFALAPERVVVVVGHGRDAVRAELAARDVAFAVQDEPLGTGHAVLAAESAIPPSVERVMVLNGDVPLIRAETLAALDRRLTADRNTAVMVTAEVHDPAAYGRIVRGRDGRVEAIVEAADASDEVLAIREINVGSYLFRSPSIFAILRRASSDNAQGEIYLTDAVTLLVGDGQRVDALLLDDPLEGRGVNSADELAELEALRAGRRG